MSTIDCPKCYGSGKGFAKCAVCGTHTGTHWHDYCPPMPPKPDCSTCNGVGKVDIVPASAGFKPGDGCRLPSNEHGVVIAVHKDHAWVYYDDSTPLAGLSHASVKLVDLKPDPNSRMVGMGNR